MNQLQNNKIKKNNNKKSTREKEKKKGASKQWLYDSPNKHNFCCITHAKHTIS